MAALGMLNAKQQKLSASGSANRSRCPDELFDIGCAQSLEERSDGRLPILGQGLIDRH
jgi:hypothetical protein